MPRPRFQLSLFGRCSLEGPDGPVDLSSKKVAGLLAYLAGGGFRPHTRERLMSLLWGTHGVMQAHQNLRQALHRLRMVLGKSAILNRGEQVSLAAEVLACDVVQFEALVKEGTHLALRNAVALYEGPFLANISITEPDWDEWVTTERQRLEHHALGAMVALGTHELGMANAEGAIQVAARAVAINPLREDAHRLILKALAAAGRKAEALAHYDRLKETLDRELGVEPDTVTRAIAAELRTTGRITTPTDPRHGRHIADSPRVLVDAIAVGCNPGTDSRPPPPAAYSPPAPRPRRPCARLAWSGGACVLLAGVALTAFASWSDKPSAPKWVSEVSNRRSEFRLPIAVLPFRASAAHNASAHEFAERIGDELTNYLSRYPILSVPPRDTVRQNRGADAPLSFWSKAGIRYAVTGNVWAQDGGVRLVVNLIDVSTQLQVWSRHFEYAIGEWPAQQEVVLRKLANAITLQAARRDGAKPYVDANRPTVGELIKRGTRALHFNPDAPEFAQAANYFGEALRREPSSTSAMIGLAAYKLLVTTNHIGDRDQLMLEAEGLLREALARDVDNHSVRYNLGVLYNLKNDASAALREFERAIEFNPSHVFSHASRGRVLLKLSRYEEALESVRYAQRLSDGKPPAGWALWQAIAQLELGHDEAAGAAFRQAFEAQPRNPYLIAGVAAFCALSGEWDAARRHVAELRLRTPGRSDEWRLWELNKGPGDQPLPNRLGQGLRLALEALPDAKAAQPATAARKASGAMPLRP